ncbi:MAG: hypothetical protein ACPK7O_01205 [Methanobacterium sp.]
MFYKKLVQLSNIQIEQLNEIQDKIKANGGYVSTAQLIRDSIQIFLNHYKKDAVNKYSANYELKEN